MWVNIYARGFSDVEIPDYMLYVSDTSLQKLMVIHDFTPYKRCKYVMAIGAAGTEFDVDKVVIHQGGSFNIKRVSCSVELGWKNLLNKPVHAILDIYQLLNEISDRTRGD